MSKVRSTKRSARARFSSANHRGPASRIQFNYQRVTVRLRRSGTEHQGAVVHQRLFYFDTDNMWKIGFAGRVQRYRDILGLRQIHQLLSRPWERISFVELDSNRRYLPGRVCFGLERFERFTPKPDDGAHKRVSSTIKYAIGKLLRWDPSFGRHLKDSIKLGLNCGYESNEVFVDWSL